MKQPAIFVSLFVVMLSLGACLTGGGVLNSDPDGGQDASDGGEDAGVIVDTGGDRPANTVFAIGVTDNSGSAPQAAPFLNLAFGDGTPSPTTVVAKRVASPPTLDGVSVDWANLPASVVALQTRGEPIGMTLTEWNTEWAGFGSTPPLFDFGITNAIVKAAFDDDNIYFLVEWADATENVRRDQLTLMDGLWTRSTENEDRLYFAFNINNSFPAFGALGCSAACHLKERVGDFSSAARSYRMRMHTNAPGELADIWSWRATTTNPMGYADDGYWDEVSRKSDSATDFVVSNRADGGSGTIVPISMSEEGVNANPAAIYAPDAGFAPLAVPYNDAGIVDLTRLPGYVHQRASPGRDDVRAVGKWRNGKWTVELSRARENTDPKDAQFPFQ
jgi:hypothetical protein